MKENRKYMSKDKVNLVKKIDLYTYLSNYDPNELEKKSKNDFVTKTHGSLHISNGKWHWFAKGIGGRTALDYLIHVEGMDFVSAAYHIYDCITTKPPVFKKWKHTINNYEFKLPPRAEIPDKVFHYLIKERCIDKEIVQYYYLNRMLYENRDDHSVVFVGYDESGKPRFATQRATDGDWKKDVYQSDKKYSFRYENADSEVLHVFESAIDLMSQQTLNKLREMEWKHENYLSLSGVSSLNYSSELPIALEQFLINNQQIRQIVLHLDNDKAGHEASLNIERILSNQYSIIDKGPKYYKDINTLLNMTVQNYQYILVG